MNSIFVNYEKASSIIEQQSSEGKKRFLRYFLMQAIQLELERKKQHIVFGQVDLLFLLQIAERLFEKQQTTVGMLEGRWREFEMLPDDL